MKEILSTITSKGRVTLPAEVRSHLGIRAGERIAFVIEPDGVVRLRIPLYPTVSALRGAAGSLETPRSWEEMQAIAHEDRLKARQANER